MKTLQEIVDLLEEQISNNLDNDQNRSSWGYEEGILLSGEDASLILETLRTFLLTDKPKGVISTAATNAPEWHLPDDDLPLTRKHFRLVLDSIDNLGLRIETLESKVAPSKDYDAAFNESLHLLRELADIQNGPPLEHQRQKWQALMEAIYAFLRKWEGESTGL